MKEKIKSIILELSDAGEITEDVFETYIDRILEIVNQVSIKSIIAVLAQEVAVLKKENQIRANLKQGKEEKNV